VRRQRAEPALRAVKVSEYVNQFTSCNAGAHLDNFAIELQNFPDAKAHIRIYGPGGQDGKFAERALEATKIYLVSTRDIEESRVEAVYAGPYEKTQELLTELWFVPRGAAPPPVTKYKPDLAFEGKYYERGLWDGPEGGEVDGWGSTTRVALVGLSELLRKRKDALAYLVAYKDALAYLVAYHGEESAPGAWRRVAERQVEEMRGEGIPAERVKVVFAGYAKEESLQFWVLPSDAPPPAKHRRERRPERSTRVADLDEYTLRYNERWAFKGFVDVLKADPQLNGCLIVRPGPADTDGPDPEEPVDPDEPPAVDVMQLAEKWKAELKKNGIAEHRLIVMVVPTRERQWGDQIETWIVPPGAPLPDPSADDIIDAEEEASENP
jgi:hypothetical protein